MSAWIVSRTHIRSLLDVALYGPADVQVDPRRAYFTGTFKWEPSPATDTDTLTLDNATAFGAYLWTENHNSVNHRYGEHKRVPAFAFKRPKYRLTLAEAFKAIHCYEYQSCEHPTWGTSNAAAFCSALARHLEHFVPGYDAAPWGIPDPDPIKTAR